MRAPRLIPPAPGLAHTFDDTLVLGNAHGIAAWEACAAARDGELGTDDEA